MSGIAIRDCRQHVEGLFSDLGKQLGIAGLRLDEEGSCTLSFNEVMVTLGYDAELEGLSLFAILDRLPGPLREEGLARLMEFNATLFEQEQASLVYNQTSLLVAQLFRIDGRRLTGDDFLPWIDRCLATIESSRLAVWDFLAADRGEALPESGESAYLRL